MPKRNTNPEHQELVDHLIASGFQRESRNVYTYYQFKVQIMDDRSLRWQVASLDYNQNLASDGKNTYLFKT